MTPTPPPLAVACLIDDDAIDPGPEGRLAAERRDGAEDPQEDFLREVEGFVPVAKQMQREAEDHPLVNRHQLGARHFVTSRTALDEGCFAAVNFRPSDGASVLHYVSREGCMHEV